jgi:hypothetical protein
MNSFFDYAMVRLPLPLLVGLISAWWSGTGWGAISANTTEAGAPSGTLSAPAYVIDSDAANGAAGYDRDAIHGYATVQFTKPADFTADSGTYRVRAQLLDANGNVVPLEGGATYAYSAQQDVAFTAVTTAATRSFEVDLDPAGDLGAGQSYTIRYWVQRWNFVTIGTLGYFTFTSTGGDGPDDSAAFTVVHFTDAVENAASRRARGWLRGAPTFSQTYAITGASGSQRLFRASVPYALARYDIGGTSTSIAVRFTAKLSDDTGMEIPLENGGVATSSFTREARVAGSPDAPHLVSGNFALSFVPLVPLDSVARTYRLEVAFEHLETTPTTYAENGVTPATALQRLLHFNGTLRFGSVATVFSATSNVPAAGVVGAGYVETVLNPPSATIVGFPDYSVAAGADLSVRLEADGDAVVTAGSRSVEVSGGGDVTAVFGGVRVRYPTTQLAATGASAASTVVELPQGLGYTADAAAAAGRYERDITLAGRSLTANFRHSGDLSLVTPAGAGAFDESRPLVFGVTRFSMTQAGVIGFDATDAGWVHRAAYDQLEANQAAGMHASASMRFRMSNDGYLRHARIASPRQIQFVANADGSARTRLAELEIDPGTCVTHFPKGSVLEWTGAGALKVENGQVAASSGMSGASKVEVAVDGTCAGDACGPAPGTATVAVSLTPDGSRLNLTADGGVHAAAAIAPTSLRWGIRSGGIATHQGGNFDRASFLCAGHQLYGSANPLAASPAFGEAAAAALSPGSLLQAAYDPATHPTPVYPGSAGYLAGTGSHAGATLVVPAGGLGGASRIADMAVDSNYVLQESVSKYYVRPSGVSGRHVALSGSFADELELYGYPFSFTRFQLTFLSNENHDSWVNGSVAVPNYSNFTQKFLGLKLTCTGALDEARIDPSDAGTKPLTYWNGSFKPLAMSFEPLSGGGCYGERFLTLGLISGAANIDTPLAGSLAFKPNGNIATLADGIAGVDSRLGLPATVPFEGPGTEVYPLVPCSKLYFTNPQSPGAPATGQVAFAARCNVPFFEDLEVHVMTSAQAGVPAGVYLASGWTESGQTFFSNTGFDATHRGFPPASAGISVADYRNPSSQTAYVPVARQSLFGLVPLSYPLRWSPSGRYFNSWAATANDLLVLNVEHQVDYLSARNAEISFGAQYEGLPEINLASAAVEVIDGQFGASHALTQAATQFVTDTLNQGVDELGNLAGDTLESVLDEVLDSMEDEVIDPLYDGIQSSYNAAVAANTSYGNWVNTGSGSLKLEFDRHLDGSIGVAANSVKGRLQQLHDMSGGAVDLISQVQSAVDQGILAIDAITANIEVAGGEATFHLEPPTVPSVGGGQIIQGLLAKVADPATGEMERHILQSLIGHLLSELAPPDLAALLTSAAGQVTGAAEDELNALLAEFDPTLDRVCEALLEVRATLVQIRSELAAGQEVFISFQQIVAGSIAEIDAITNGLRATAYAFIDDIAASATYGPTTALGTAGNLMGEFSREEFKAMIRAELRDRLMASAMVQQIQYVLRQQIAELGMAMNSAIDSAFSEVSRMCKELVKEALGPIDDAIGPLLGEVDDYLGAGSVDGYAHIQDDTLRRLRLDAEVRFKVPDDMQLNAYFEMLCYDSSCDVGSAGCLAAGQQAVEVKIGALDVPLDWASPDLRANLEVRFSMQTAPTVVPKGVGGSLVMTGGELDFQSLKITEFAASVAVGADECYLAATARVIISSYEAAGGIFFGRTCSLAPLELVDPDVAALLGTPPFTGAYVYGEVWIPISEVVLGVPASCMFRISAGVGAGAFYFAEGPTYGGKMMLGVSGEALCAVSISGDVTMIGVMSGGSLRFTGKGTLAGKAGWCPLCVKFNESAKVSYQDGSWSVDF